MSEIVSVEQFNAGTLPKKLGFILADLIEDGLIKKDSAWATALTEAIAAVQPGEPVAWLVTRERDGTFPKAFTSKTVAEITAAGVSLPPYCEVVPLYATPAPVAVTEWTLTHHWNEERFNSERGEKVLYERRTYEREAALSGQGG